MSVVCHCPDPGRAFHVVGFNQGFPAAGNGGSSFPGQQILPGLKPVKRSSVS